MLGVSQQDAVPILPPPQMASPKRKKRRGKIKIKKSVVMTDRRESQHYRDSVYNSNLRTNDVAPTFKIKIRKKKK